MLSERNSPKDVCLIASIESAIAVMNLKEVNFDNHSAGLATQWSSR